MLRLRITAAIVAVALGAVAWVLPKIRRELIRDVISWDAPRRDPAPLPAGTGPGLSPTPRTRVVLIDGLSASVTPTLPTWSALCKRGVTLRVDVGFPTVSLPVESALWTGLTQQQTGIVFRSDRPLEPPIDKRGIPAQIEGSVAIAENHGWIVRSLGFARTEPAADPMRRARDLEPELWAGQWEARAADAIGSDAKLVFVHILRVDVAGHKYGMGNEYTQAAGEADAILARLLSVDRDARWFILSDHGHVAAGGHGGEERHVRHVESCIAGPGIAVAKGQLVHVVDLARALADSTGAVLDNESRGRPLSSALASPLLDDQSIPPMELGAGAAAIFILVAGLGLATWGVRRWWLAPWWFVAACASLFIVRGEPTLSMRMVYAGEGRDMYLVWLPSLALAVAATIIGLRRMTIARVVISQLAFPIAAVAAVITASGAWPALFGDAIAPVVPRYTAWMSPLILMVAHGAGAVALGALATLVRPPSDRFERTAPPRTAPAAEP